MTDLVSRPLPIRNLAELNDVTITSIADGEIIVWDSGTSRYINQTLAEAGIVSAIDDLTDVTITAAASGDFLRHNGTAWVDATIVASDLPAMVGDSGAGGTQGAVPAPAAGDAAANKYLKADGTWATVAGGGASAIDDLSDVTITAAASGDFLRHNGTAWVDATIVASDLPAMVGDSGSGGTKGAVPAPAAGDAAANKYLKADGTWATVAGGGASAIDDLSDVTITAAASGDFLRHNGTAWVDATIQASDLPEMVGDSGSGGTKGAVPAPAAGDAAGGKYLDASGGWSAPAGGGGGGTTGWDANILVNSSFQNWTHGATSTTAPTPSAFTAVNDDVYGGPGRWNFLRESVSLKIKQATGISGVSSKAIEIKNESGSAGGFFGIEQIVESGDTLALRGADVVASVWIEPQTETKTYSLIILEWTGTADSVISDVVNDWDQGTIAESSFITSSANHAVLASDTLSCSTGSWQQLEVSATVGSSANNLIVLCAQHGTGNDMSNNASVKLTAFGLYRGTTAPDYIETPYAQTERDCQRWHVCMTGAGISDFYKSGRKVLTTRIRAFYDALPVPMRAAPTVTNNVSGWTAGNPGTTTIAGYDEMASASVIITGALTFNAAAYDRFRWTCYAQAGTSFSGTTGDYIEMSFGEDVVLHFDCSL